jgi:hypothetical protein
MKDHEDENEPEFLTLEIEEDGKTKFVTLPVLEANCIEPGCSRCATLNKPLFSVGKKLYCDTCMMTEFNRLLKENPPEETVFPLFADWLCATLNEDALVELATKARRETRKYMMQEIVKPFSERDQTLNDVMLFVHDFLAACKRHGLEFNEDGSTESPAIN